MTYVSNTRRACVKLFSAKAQSTNHVQCFVGFKSLFDELYDAGLLAVGALEKGLGLSTEEKGKGPSSTSSSGAASSASPGSQSQQPPNSARCAVLTFCHVGRMKLGEEVQPCWSVIIFC